MPFVITQDGTEISYRDWGAGTPVVLIHGWPLDQDMWERQANFLAGQKLRVITYDRRGFGHSGQPWNGYDYDTFAADLNTLMEKLNLTGATLVGFSMGGGEVVRYLSRYGSARVTKAVLISAITPFLMQTADNPEGVNPSVFDEMGESILKDRAAFLKDFGPNFYGRSLVNHTVSESVLEWTQAVAYRSSLRPTIAAAKAFAQTDFRADMKGITIPVRIIHGTSDAIVPIDKSGRRSAKILPSATLTEYDGEPHALFFTAAERLNRELLSFIEG